MLIDALKNQFARAFDILDSAVASFDDAAWRAGSPAFNGPARATAHVLQCAEYYPHREKAVFDSLGKPVWQMTDDELPPQEQMKEYSAGARQMTLDWIDAIGDERLTDPDETFGTALEAIAYALRHLQHHIGELCAYQKAAGLEPAEWK